MSKMAKHLMALGFALVLALALPLFAFAAEAADDQNEALQNYVNERQIPDGSFLYDTSIEVLASADILYDNTTVVVTGEVVGDRIAADVGSNSSWITLYSLHKKVNETYNPSSIQVYVSNTLADTIDTYGRYNAHGTHVQVNGTFHLACVDHDGISDIHADSLQVVQAGARVNDPLILSEFFPGIIAVALGLLLMLVYRRMKERAR